MSFDRHIEDGGRDDETLHRLVSIGDLDDLNRVKHALDSRGIEVAVFGDPSSIGVLQEQGSRLSSTGGPEEGSPVCTVGHVRRGIRSMAGRGGLSACFFPVEVQKTVVGPDRSGR